MNSHLRDLLREGGGVITRREAMLAVSPHALDWALQRGSLTRVLPGTYVDSTDDRTLARAAARYAAPGGALSHTTALWRWGLISRPPRPLHITVPLARQPRGTALLVAHRRAADLAVIWRDELPLVPIERAVLESAPLLERDQRRAALITAVRERRTTALRLHLELQRIPVLRGRTELRRLVTLLGEGCQSELELFGYAKVFSDPSLPSFVRQYPVRLRDRTIYLDLAEPVLRIGIELDGAQYHDRPEAIERDRRRDVELATIGWIALRFGARRLNSDPKGVRGEVRAVVEIRRSQLLAS